MADLSAENLFLPLPGEVGRYRLRLLRGGPVGPVLPAAYEPDLYLRPAHRALQPNVAEWLNFYLEDTRAGTTHAELAVAILADSGQGSSPAQGSFGGVQQAEKLSARMLHQFLTGVQAYLAGQATATIEIKSSPSIYHPAASALQTQALLQLGYQISQSEINSHLPLDTSFEAGLYKDERVKLRKCRAAGMLVEQEPPWLLPAAYEFWETCRAERGHGPLLPLARLQELFQLFPAHHFLHSVRDAQGQWAALILSIQVNSRVLYTFYSGSPRAYAAYSPTVLLHEGLHAFGRSLGCEVLDIGTAALPSGPNFPLLQFKEHLGAVASLKLTFRR